MIYPAIRRWIEGLRYPWLLLAGLLLLAVSLIVPDPLPFVDELLLAVAAALLAGLRRKKDRPGRRPREFPVDQDKDQDA